jgi:hypothetical protein
MSSLDKPAPNRHFVSHPDQGLFRHIFTHAPNFKHNRAGPDSRHPEFGFTFTLAHSRFQRLAAYGLMWEHPEINLALAVQEMSGRNSASLDALGAYPAIFQSLQTIFTESHEAAS